MPLSGQTVWQSNTAMNELANNALFMTAALLLLVASVTIPIIYVLSTRRESRSVRRPSSRRCLSCGERFRGSVACPMCGYDYRETGAGGRSATEFRDGK